MGSLSGGTEVGGKDPKELCRERMGRVIDAVALRVPDRVQGDRRLHVPGGVRHLLLADPQEALRRGAGGLIDNARPENLRAMFDSVEKYGRR
jgi:hypothetical protein